MAAGIPGDRAGVALRAMRAGKDAMVDKPGCTTEAELAELRRVQAETGRIFSICYSEHYLQPATVAAARLVAEGAIGRVVSTIGLGPHRVGLHARPDWFWDTARGGSILVDIASHQFEQFLHFTGSTDGPHPLRRRGERRQSRARPAGATTATPPSPPTTPPASSASTG